MRPVLLAGSLALLLWPVSLDAQQEAGRGRFALTGIVLDSLTGRPVVAATVTFDAARRVVFTDSEGRFALTTARGGAEQVQVRQIGYATVSFQAEIHPDNPPLLIFLAPDPVPLEAITARARASGRLTIEGTVADSATGRPLPNVVVWFRTSGGSAVTDALGHYVFEAARPGAEDILVDVVGYRRQAAFRRIADPWQRLDFALPPNPFELQAVVAFGRRRHESVLAQGFSRVLTERDLAASGVASGHDFLRWAQTLSPPVGLDCEPSQVMILPKGRGNMSGQPVARPPRDPTAGWLLPPLQAMIIVDGQWVGTTWVEADRLSIEDFKMSPGEFYQAIVRQTAGCRGGNRPGFVAVTVYSKSFMRRMARRPGALKPIPFDSLEALMARADSLR